MKPRGVGREEQCANDTVRERFRHQQELTKQKEESAYHVSIKGKLFLMIPR